jgi:hypothetical protein
MTPADTFGISRRNQCRLCLRLVETVNASEREQSGVCPYTYRRPIHQGTNEEVRQQMLTDPCEIKMVGREGFEPSKAIRRQSYSLLPLAARAPTQ